MSFPLGPDRHMRAMTDRSSTTIGNGTLIQELVAEAALNGDLPVQA